MCKLNKLNVFIFFMSSKVRVKWLIIILKLSMSVVVKWHPTSGACGQVGDLKLLCPNVRRYKLLMSSYLPMFSWFSSAETKVQKNYQCSITFVSPHLPQTHVGSRAFLSHYFPLFRLLSSLHNIWQFSSIVFPLSFQGVMWSPSISDMSNSFLQIIHFRPCFS